MLPTPAKILMVVMSLFLVSLLFACSFTDASSGMIQNEVITPPLHQSTFTLSNMSLNNDKYSVDIFLKGGGASGGTWYNGGAGAGFISTHSVVLSPGSIIEVFVGAGAPRNPVLPDFCFPLDTSYWGGKGHSSSVSVRVPGTDVPILFTAAGGNGASGYTGGSGSSGGGGGSCCGGSDAQRAGSGGNSGPTGSHPSDGGMPLDMPYTDWVLQYQYYNETTANAWVNSTYKGRNRSMWLYVSRHRPSPSE